MEKTTTLERICQLEELWQDDELGTLAKFCAQWDHADWEQFIRQCFEQGLDIDEECQRLYEEKGDF